MGKDMEPMKDLSKYTGIFPAFYACFDQRNAVSPERVKDLVRYFIKRGVDGIYVNSPAGECLYMSVEERKLLLENVMGEARGKLKVICHVGCNSTRDSFSLAEHAEAQGVDAISAISPLYFRLPDYSVAKYWNQLSGAAPNTDFIVHNAPALTGTGLSRELFTKMWENERFVGVIDQTASAEDIQMQFALAGQDYVIFNGDDEYFLPGKALGMVGAMGGISGIMPDLYVKMEECVDQGELPKARAIMHDVLRIVEEMRKAHADLLAVAKGVIRRSEVMDIGGVRSPLPALYDADYPVVKAVMDRIRDAREKYL